MSHPEVDLTKAAHADLGKCSPRGVSTFYAHAAVNNPGAVVELMIGSIEFLGILCQVFENFECKFVYAEHMKYPLYQ